MIYCETADRRFDAAPVQMNVFTENRRSSTTPIVLNYPSGTACVCIVSLWVFSGVNG